MVAEREAIKPLSLIVASPLVCEPIDAQLDRILGMLWGLTRRSDVPPTRGRPPRHLSCGGADGLRGQVPG
jgi:hypothetical protein